MTHRSNRICRLQGVRVLDLSAVVLGPYASQNLAEYGADVIKIEPPEGDSTRRTGPSTEPGMGAIFLGVNRGKRSVVLDLKRADARAALLTLVDTADVLMHSIRPQKLAAIGLDPDTLLARNPRLVYVGLHGFAEDGPYGGMPAYDDIIQGLSGVRGADGAADRRAAVLSDDRSRQDLRPGRDARHPGRAVQARAHRQGRLCRGADARIDGVLQSGRALLRPPLSIRRWPIPAIRASSPSTAGPTARPTATLCAMPYTDAHWKRFFTEGGMPEAAADPRFANITERTRNIDALYTLAAQVIETRSTDEWLEGVRPARSSGLAHEPTGRPDGQTRT